MLRALVPQTWMMVGALGDAFAAQGVDPMAAPDPAGTAPPPPPGMEGMAPPPGAEGDSSLWLTLWLD